MSRTLSLEERFKDTAVELQWTRQSLGLATSECQFLATRAEAQKALLADGLAAVMALLGAFGNRHPDGTPESECEERARKWMAEVEGG